MSSTPKERCCSRTASAACRDKLYASAPNRYHIPTVVAVLFLGGSEDSVPFVLGWSEWLYRIYTVILFDSYIYYVFIVYILSFLKSICTSIAHFQCCIIVLTLICGEACYNSLLCTGMCCINLLTLNL